MSTDSNNEIKQLIGGLGHFRTRPAAMQRLLEMGHAAAPILLAALRETPPAFSNKRWALIELLRMLRYRDAAPDLVAIVREDPALRGDAVRALREITGLDGGEDAADWERLLFQEGQGEAAATATQPREEKTRAQEEQVESPATQEPPGLALIRRAFEGVASRFEWNADERYVYLRLPTNRGRKQQMLILFDRQDEDGRSVVEVYTECGPASPSAEQAAFRRNVTLQYGKFMIDRDEDGTGKVVMRHTMRLEGLTSEDLREIVTTMARDADHFEFDLTNSDRI